MTYHIMDGIGGQWLAETTSEYPEPVGVGRIDDILRDAAVVQQVIYLFNRNGGWIPGADYKRLAEILGVDPDRLVHWDADKGAHHIPEEESKR